MKTRLLALLVAALGVSCLASCGSSDQPKRKKVVGPDDSAYSKLSWNRPRSWEGNARYGGMMPTSR